MADRETVIMHLQIINTWASFARERDLQFFTAKHLEDIAQWSDDALNLLKEQEESIPVSWLTEKLEGHPELPYAVTDGINNVLDLWEGR